MGRKKLEKDSRKSINKTFRVTPDQALLIELSGICWAEIARQAVLAAAGKVVDKNIGADKKGL